MTFSTLTRRPAFTLLGLAGVAVVVVGSYAISASAASGHAAKAAAPVRPSAASTSANPIVGEWSAPAGKIVITQTAKNTYIDTSVTKLALMGGSTCSIPAGTSQGTITGKGPDYTDSITTYNPDCSPASVTDFPLTLSGRQLNEDGEIWTRIKLAVTTGSLPSGKLHHSYSKRLAATGGNFPYYEWSVTGGSLPRGLRLNAATGVISGTPTSTGTAHVTITVRSLAEAARPAPSGSAARHLTLHIAS
jgi:hypothetical protein